MANTSIEFVDNRRATGSGADGCIICSRVLGNGSGIETVDRIGSVGDGWFWKILVGWFSVENIGLDAKENWDGGLDILVGKGDWVKRFVGLKKRKFIHREK